jgi:lysophospholipid acyltransferase (LPLAT)-like uncharacterized protein
LKRLLRSRPVLRGAGHLLAAYLKLVQRTNPLAVEPADAYARLDAMGPVILALWHGQHFMIPFGKRAQDRFAVLISRHGDGEINATACEDYGIRPIRGSGAQRADQVRKRGGAAGLRGMLAALENGESVTLTADVPKIARVAGRGILTLAQLSGRPIVPVALTTSRTMTFASWDRASLGLPFGRSVMVLGEPITVPRSATASGVEALRQQLEAALDAVNARAAAAVGGRDPGASLPGIAAARARAAGGAADAHEASP